MGFRSFVAHRKYLLRPQVGSRGSLHSKQLALSSAVGACVNHLNL